MLASDAVVSTAKNTVWPGWDMFADWSEGYVFQRQAAEYVLQGQIMKWNLMGTNWLKVPVLAKHFGHTDLIEVDEEWIRKHGNQGLLPPPGKIVVSS